MESQDGSSATTSITEDGTPGCYTLREIIRDVPLSTDEEGVQAHITCVDAWNGNLYIGTSSGEVLHYVSIPPDPSDESGQPVYIFATRIEPGYTTLQTGAEKGVKQILLLPSAGKACIVCNSTLTFYTLPELSPAWAAKYTQNGCLWVGGLDRNGSEEENGQKYNGPIAVICLRSKIRLIRIGDDPRRIRDIELGGVGALERRGDVACVADGESYSLLDVVNQRKNTLFPISSLSIPSPVLAQQETVPPLPQQRRPPSRSFSSRSPAREGRSHQRIVSLGGQPQSSDRLRPDSNSPWPARRSSRQEAESPAPPSSREESPKKTEDAPEVQSAESIEAAPVEAKVVPEAPLRANIVTPMPNEFLLTTGTKRSDPGVGLFVNLDGDVVRGTMEFSSYPESLVLDNGESASMPSDEAAEGWVLAMVRQKVNEKSRRCIEMQRWDVDPGEAHRSKEIIVLGDIEETLEADAAFFGYGLRNARQSSELAVTGISTSLRLRRLKVKDTIDSEADQKRTAEEDKLAARFSQVRANVLTYAVDRVSWLVREPMLLQLDKQLRLAMTKATDEVLSIDVPVVQRVVNGIRGQEPRDELEFVTLTYIRQKAALLLFGNLILQTTRGVISYEHDKRRTEDALTAGEIDPRIVLTLVPPFDSEISEGPGIWMPQGLRDTVDWLREGIDLSAIDRNTKGPFGDNILSLIKRFLMAWRKKKGFGSVADEANVFRSVDAALIHVLLLLDQDTPRGPASAGSTRAELNDVVDRGVDCFDRAIELLEEHHRLYILSRLYQSKKNVSKVLATWKRILDGEKDAGGELIEGEHEMRKYLSKLRDAGLVQEYAAWLANRNPKLGVQIFADDSSRVKFEPSQAVAILKEKAPGAVKDYLEHLVFGKNHIQYVNDLIAFYLDTVLHELQNSKEARQTLLESYEIYRAQYPPKPTYSQFITDNAVEAEWWHNRLRLLQLIGGSHGAASKYDVHALRERLAPYSNELVPEMIILNGREGKHEEALRLLTHGLGDYDTAIHYCLRGGSSIFHPSARFGADQELPSHEEQSKLFNHLLSEFFMIEDPNERLERTAELLERYSGWFDLLAVLDLVPDDWSVELVSGFLVHAFRRLVREKNETVIVKALCSAQNLQKNVQAIEKIEGLGPVLQVEDMTDAAAVG
ncbi:Transforming growth factor-beta receptor-associated protein 1 [Pseudocercospora fuligena]|uniref:Transforming growth factor-beta receptor-associated protein 1 n=1 Tax=Pseudocercospora fuligena TaxID=685502 RepID=A0A8H6R9N5_9PEZI|nr:Transforming growth factor-beta receptor-associated protein 1 [Pseudocercospora fuligena]